MYIIKERLHKKQKKYKPGSLRTIALDVTSRCNMTCRHCYAETFRNVEPVDLKFLKRTFDELYEIGVFHYVLQGGEAIIDSERLEKIISMIYPDETYITVVSNGWEMSKEKINWLKELKVDKIAFSLDSGIEENHDKNRLPGSFKKVKEAVDNVVDSKLDTSVSCVLTKNFTMTKDFEFLIDYVKTRKVRLDVQVAMPVGNWDGNLDCLASDEDIKVIKNLQNELPLLPNGQSMIKRDLYIGNNDHCPAVSEFMGISADGNLLPCNFMQFSMGSIREKSISEMRNNFIRSEWFNGSQKVCLLGENLEFINKYVIPFVGKNKPLDADSVFLKGGF